MPTLADITISDYRTQAARLHVGKDNFVNAGQNFGRSLAQIGTSIRGDATFESLETLLPRLSELGAQITHEIERAFETAFAQGEASAA